MNPQPFTTCVGSSARPAREAARRGRLPSRAAAWRRTRRGSCRSRASAAIAVERFVAVATPAVRILARGARFTRVPWVLVASTSVSLTTTIRAGVREVRVIGSLLAHRLEQETGAAADPALVKKLAVELYLAPRRKPDVTTLNLPFSDLARRWLFRGIFGRDTRKLADRALDAAERLDVDRVLETRRAATAPPAAGPSPDRVPAT